ncbi:hypothetical protein DFH09DRAFT_1412421 [Mycena vulgaris]|nr:hypothetical protein DFH09DRAFT_1412421 [Mycena vulgaris]
MSEAAALRRPSNAILNAILDPMARLPLEISSDIIMQCLPAIPRADPLTMPMVFLKLWHSWSNNALSTSALWTSIQIEFPRAPGFEHLFDAWLKRAGTRATSISLRGPLPQAEASVLNEHAPRVQKLQLYFFVRDATETDKHLVSVLNDVDYCARRPQSRPPSLLLAQCS